jgi:hypothetical protein
MSDTAKTVVKQLNGYSEEQIGENSVNRDICACYDELRRPSSGFHDRNEGNNRNAAKFKTEMLSALKRCKHFERRATAPSYSYFGGEAKVKCEFETIRISLLLLYSP